MKTIMLIAGLAGALAFTSAAFAAGNSTPGIDRYHQISSNPNPDAREHRQRNELAANRQLPCLSVAIRGCFIL